MGARAPNILFLMSDQMGAPVLPIHGHPVCQTPHIEALADSGVVFDSAYCNYPLCAPARFSMLAGRLAPSIGAFDNASEFTADTPTLAHYLSLLGYRTILCGKMHFIGPDQLHGFEERLTTDVYPASFSFLPDWEKGPKWISSGTDLSSVVEAGPCLRSLQIDYDDEVEFFATQKLFDLARDDRDRPFFLCVSFTQPHSPYTPGQEHWDRYRHDDILFPIVLVLCVYGGYAVNNNLFDILVMMLIGLLGFGMLRANIPAAPFLIAFVLGPLLEDNFRQSLLLSHGSLDIFVRNEICWIFWCLTVIAVVLIIRRQRKIPGTE